LWYIFLGFFVIAIAEGSRIIHDTDQGFTMFAVLFEIVSAYGTVGLSLGYPTINASFSAEFGVVSKLVIIAMQIRGRHRGLPYELDRAIMLKGELLRAKEDEMASRSIRRRSSNATIGTTSGADTGIHANGAGGSRTDLGENRKRELSLSRGRSTFDRGTEIFSALLRPGPTMPNQRRRTGDFDRPSRSQSAVDLGRNRESVMTTGENIADTAGNGTRSRRLSGRRTFHQEGLNNA